MGHEIASQIVIVCKMHLTYLHGSKSMATLACTQSASSLEGSQRQPKKFSHRCRWWHICHQINMSYKLNLKTVKSTS